MTDGHDFLAKLDSVTFNGNEFDWTDGFWVTDVEGISSGGAVTYDRVPRGFGPGVHDVGNQREDPRIFALTGFVYAESAADLGNLIDQLGGLLVDDDATALFEWQQYGADWRRASVRRFGAPDIDRQGSTGFAQFRISLRASDQRIYGTPKKTARAAAVEGLNLGTYPAPLVLEVQGDSPAGWTAAGPNGAVVVVNAALVAGSTHRYDGDTGMLAIDGAPQITGVTRSDAIEAPQGDFTISVNNGCTVQVFYASTWAP